MLIGCLINTKYYLIVLINEPGKATISRSIHLFLKNTIVLYTILVKLTFFFFWSHWFGGDQTKCFQFRGPIKCYDPGPYKDLLSVIKKTIYQLTHK